MKNKLKRKKIAVKLIGLILSVIVLGGCWSTHEPNNLAIINGMGIDRSENGEYKVTMIMIRPEALFSLNLAETGSGFESPLLMTTATGKTIYEAIQKMANTLSKRLVWTSMDVVVFGEKIAREGLAPVMDVMIRNSEFRPNLKVFITKGEAHDILKLKPQLENTIGSEFFNFTIYSRLNSTPYVADMLSFLGAVNSNTKDPLTGEISPAFKDGIEFTEVGIKKSELETGISVSGLAVFKDDKLVGWLNNHEARGVSLIRGDEQTGVVSIDCPKKNGKISFEIYNSISKLIPSSKDGKHQIDVNLKVDSTLREITCPNLNLDSEKIDLLNELVEEKITELMTDVLNKVQKEWQSDIFGFGEAFYKKQPAIWKELAPTWNDGGLKDLEVNLNVNVNNYRAGLMHDPINANESR